MKTFFGNKSYVVSALIIAFVFGGLLGRISKSDVIVKPKVLREDGFKYIRPVLLCNTDYQKTYSENLALSKLYKDYLKTSNNNISVYYLSLSNGDWASINEDVTFSPASMLKVPTVVDALKYVESHPDIMQKYVYFNGVNDANNAEYFKSDKRLQSGKYYSFDDLLSYTIVDSDNNALNLIHQVVNSRSLNELYSDLKIDVPKNASDFMTAKTYTLFLRILYNSTYLNRTMSEKVLGLMANSNFPIGLRSGVPKDVIVADKFGERTFFTPSGENVKNELHDCGIIYTQNNNYILCVMTSGKDLNSLAQNISDISKLTYNQVK